MTTNNPFHHQTRITDSEDPDLNDFAKDPQGVINYFQGRFLENPTNNPHSPQNQPGAGGGTTTTAPAAPTGPTANDLWMQQVRDILMQRLAAAGQPVDVNAPEITSAVTAARDEGTRASEQERTALAERLYAQAARAPYQRPDVRFSRK
jgi:hypothetical protein